MLLCIQAVAICSLNSSMRTVTELIQVYSGSATRGLRGSWHSSDASGNDTYSDASTAGNILCAKPTLAGKLAWLLAHPLSIRRARRRLSVSPSPTPAPAPASLAPAGPVRARARARGALAVRRPSQSGSEQGCAQQRARLSPLGPVWQAP